MRDEDLDEELEEGSSSGSGEEDSSEEAPLYGINGFDSSDGEEEGEKEFNLEDYPDDEVEDDDY